MTALVDIGDVIRRSGVPATTLHVWERHGLIQSAGRNGMRRQYEPDVFGRLASVVVLKDAGFRLSEIAALFRPDAFEDGKGVLRDKLAELVERRDHLDRAIDGVRHAIDCPNPDPLRCSGFQQHLVDALPMQRRPR